MSFLGDLGHGLKKRVDKVGDKAEGLWDEGKKQVGKGVRYVSHEVGDGLDAVGMHGLADGVDDFGDNFASRMGAHVSEQQLGETEEANELIHGKPGKIRSSASHLSDFAAAFGRVRDGMSRLDSEHWKGKGADAFREKFAMHPPQWGHAAKACEDAAKALTRYAETVTWAQGKAKEAIALYKEGKREQKEAFDAYKAQVEAFDKAAKEYNAKLDGGKDPGTRPTPPGSCPNAGADKMQHAQEVLTNARTQRNSAAEAAAAAVKGALAHAPKKPAFSDRMEMNLGDFESAAGVELTHFAGGMTKGAAGAVKFVRTVAPIDPYNVTHPGQYLTHMTNMGAGIMTLANHPDRIPSSLLGTGWGKDPSEASGRLGFDVLTGLASGGTSVGATAARRAAVNVAEHGLEEAGARGLRGLGKEAEREAGAGRGQFNNDPHGAAKKDGQRDCGGTDPVDLASGYMFLAQTDVSLPGALPLAFTRRVGSDYRAGHWFGPSWSSTVDQRLEIDAKGVVFVREDGMILSYPHPAPGVPTLPSHGPRWPLEPTEEGGYTVTDVRGNRTWHFTAPIPCGDDRHEISLLDQIADRNGHWITFDYSDEGVPTGITHHAGYHIRITTHGSRVTALHLGDVELMRYGYADGNLTEVVNSSGLPLRFTYDDRRRPTSWTDRNDRSYRYEYDDRDRCVHETGEAGHLRCTLEYGDPDPETGLRVTTLTSALGHTSRHVFDKRSRLVAETDPTGATTLFTWDGRDRLVARTDPLGHTTAFSYDEAGDLLSVRRPDGSESTAEYNALGLPETITEPGGATWRQTYDAAGNRTSVTDPSGATTRYAYDETGHLTAVTDALGHVTRLRCDAAGLPSEVTDPLGGTTRYERDAFGRTVAVTDPLGATTRLAWTTEGLLARRTDPDGAEESWTYDGEGNCVTHTDALGGVTRNEYTHFDLLTARTTPDGVRHTFTHDTELRLQTVTNPQGLTWTYAYDPAGRLTSETDFDGRTLTYAHDAAGRLTERTNGLGETIGYHYDPVGRITRKDAAGKVTTYAHDAAGRLVEAAGPDVTLVYSRDRLGRVKSETANGRTLSYTYDKLGRRTRRVTPGGAVTTWTYDAAGRRTGLTASGHAFAMEHDAAGREVARHFGEGLTLTHAWNAAGRLTTQTLTSAPDNDPLQHRSFTYRQDGSLTGITDSTTGPRTFDLDTAGRVTAVHAQGWTERYAYDEAGNQTQASWPTDHPGAEAHGPRTYTGTRIVRAGRIRYEHDAQGRVVVRQKTRLSRKPETWRYSWDAEDRLTEVITPDGTKWRYLYDPFGRRTAKHRLTPAGDVAEQVHFTWDGPTLAEQTTTSTDLPNPVTLTWDHDGLHPVAQTERISAAEAPQREIDRRFFAIVTDLVGTPTELIDETGTTAWRSRATLWGTTAWATDSSTYTPLRFPGQYFDPEAGLHYNFHRYYDPETGRYFTPDPLCLEAAPNPVAYVDNPHRWTDPLGLAPYENNGGLGKLIKVRKPDPAADALAERLGGESRVRFEHDPKGREIDAVSDEYVAQSKPGGMQMGSALRNQVKATFEHAIQSGRKPYFHFEGEPGPGVIAKLREYGRRYNIDPVIDTTPLG
ncbi:RHS domain-containing protein [Streptomyces mobaraensis NBRC 13819 = DSM 40847]|uniref:Rhs protein n=1 Tax=Streptomyces mobaraensis (strain ATCC 29032 / DSM 40847 / JCM 4168 / NBRC 13819 / NCIMB 11159 / IPCR 16-22) TaxID=1223523 RepID=M3CDP5_STRM1|nr:restriction endonuclease fold toxin [Streptomyces mobaraensis]EMF02197.1 Rhs protein [Streptomyces mobaraensis NBRC 13819 = DSM 40847]QTT72658.1 RHS domain-containing protein [Streptomyces mobaraensis NBRC 13819 = DSM 40847]